MSGEIPKPAHDPWPELKARWEEDEKRQMDAAINDPRVQTFAGLLPFCTGALTPGQVIDSLDLYVTERYPDLPIEKRVTVFIEAAGIFMEQEMNFNGEA